VLHFLRNFKKTGIYSLASYYTVLGFQNVHKTCTKDFQDFNDFRDFQHFQHFNDFRDFQEYKDFKDFQDLWLFYLVLWLFYRRDFKKTAAAASPPRPVGPGNLGPVGPGHLPNVPSSLRTLFIA